MPGPRGGRTIDRRGGKKTEAHERTRRDAAGSPSTTPPRENWGGSQHREVGVEDEAGSLRQRQGRARQGKSVPTATNVSEQ